MSNKVLYSMKIPYPWKKTVYTPWFLTLPIFIILFVFTTYEYFYVHTEWNKVNWILGSIFIFSLYFGLNGLMRYILIHGDKIKAPIEVMVKEISIVWKKGPRRQEFALAPIKDITFLLTDRKVKIDANYSEKVGTLLGWMMQFRVHSELNDYEDYRKFLKEIYPEFKRVLIEQIKKLNPNVEIKEEDRRKKYR